MKRVNNNEHEHTRRKLRGEYFGEMVEKSRGATQDHGDKHTRMNLHGTK